MAYIAESGIAFTHSGVFEQVAHALDRVIVVRNTAGKQFEACSNAGSASSGNVIPLRR